MIIVRLSRKDVREIVGLYDGKFPDGWNEDMLSSSFDNVCFSAIGCYSDGKLIGIAAYMAVDVAADLEMIFVSPESRKKGVATFLLQEAEKALKDVGVGQFFLEVREGNAAAMSFYEKNGFLKLSVRKKYYDDGENAQVMFKRL